jgi:hypothetical protein
MADAEDAYGAVLKREQGAVVADSGPEGAGHIARECGNAARAGAVQGADVVPGFGERDGELRSVPPRPRRSGGRQGPQHAALVNRHRAASAGLSAARP